MLLFVKDDKPFNKTYYRKDSAEAWSKWIRRMAAIQRVNQHVAHQARRPASTARIRTVSNTQTGVVFDQLATVANKSHHAVRPQAQAVEKEWQQSTPVAKPNSEAPRTRPRPLRTGQEGARDGLDISHSKALSKGGKNTQGYKLESGKPNLLQK